MMSFHLTCTHYLQQDVTSVVSQIHHQLLQCIHNRDPYDVNVAYSAYSTKHSSLSKLISIYDIAVYSFFFRLNKNVLQKQHDSFDVHWKYLPSNPYEHSVKFGGTCSVCIVDVDYFSFYFERANTHAEM